MIVSPCCRWIFVGARYEDSLRLVDYLVDVEGADGVLEIGRSGLG